MPDLPWFNYEGQTTDELLALADRYRIDSLVCAFEEAIQAKEAASQEESYVLAIEALEREVNNGGYGQFFVNSSAQFVPIVVDALNAIRCPKAAAITADSIAAQDDPTTLEACDRRYFAAGEPIAAHIRVP